MKYDIIEGAEMRKSPFCKYFALKLP